ncbi:DUF5700 domain-containing putative Zn-dependent protease [Gimibacter soli]|uniref:Uncharacterized protein n=1 Tax=Gimibacter soli TaxID=3024400 RepID=A0AAE9XRH3_9PROT|nr:DUF5700 domain-containing putative Zn-dependent protease [Gimibacter soli]WCL54754.1 hypothetical protein PH603_03145 [Gimibacter soli]
MDASYAQYLLDMVCSGKAVDEAYLRALPVLQGQIKHHSEVQPLRNMDSFLAGLKDASDCKVPEKDLFRFGALVKEKAKFQAAVDFFKARDAEIGAYIVDKVSPYVPAGLDYTGNLVLSVVGNPCGGFATSGYFYLALNCLKENTEGEYAAAKVVSAHEVYHDIQYRFFYPVPLEMGEVKTRDQAFTYIFKGLLHEGTAEYVANSHEMAGEGTLTDTLNQFSAAGYAQLSLNTRFFSDSADILMGGDDIERRTKDVFFLGLTGIGRQAFYYVGAGMARHIETAYGRPALLCVMKQPPEQFVRAYQQAVAKAPGEGTEPMGSTMMAAANRLSDTRDAKLRFEACRS